MTRAAIVRAAASAALVVVCPNALFATDYVWVPTAGGAFDWGVGGNWNPAGPPNANSDTADLSVGITASQTINLNSTFTVALLKMGSTASPVTTHVANGGAGNLILESGSGTVSLISNGVKDVTNRIGVPVQLNSLVQLEPSINDLQIAGPITVFGANRNLNNLATVLLNITGPINLSEVGAVGGRAISLNRDPNTDLSVANGNFHDIHLSGTISDGPGGPGTVSIGPIGTQSIQRSNVTISGNNTFTGNITANRVNLVIASNTAFGTATFTPSSSTGAFGPAIFSDDDSRTIANPVQFGQFWSVRGDQSITFTGSMIQGNNRAVINFLPADKTLTLGDLFGANSLADNRTFVVEGPGRTIVTGNVLGTSNTTGTWTGTTTFEKRGTGTATVNGAAAISGNSYNGGTRVRGGLLEFATAAGYGNSVGMTIDHGGALGLLTGSTDATFLGKLATGGGVGPSNIGAASLASNGALALAPSDAAVNLDFSTNLGQAGTNLQNMGVGAVSGGVTYTGTITPANSTYRLGGGDTLTLPNDNQLTGANGMTATNGGTVVINGSNTYTGATRIGGNYIVPTQELARLNGGTLLLMTPVSLRVDSTVSVNTLADGGAPSSLGSAASTADKLVIDGATLQYTGAAANSDRLFSIGPNGATLDSSGTGAINFTNTGALTILDAATRAATVGTGSIVQGSSSLSSAQVLFTDDISDLKVGMTIDGAAIGIPAGTTIIGLHPPSYGNWGQTSANGPFQILISQPASATLVGNVTFGGQNRTLSLTGTNTDNNIIRPNLADSATGKLDVVKTGTGTWRLSGSNTYTGTTTVKQGRLILFGGGAHAPVLAGAGGADVQGGRLVFDYSGAATVAPTVLGILDDGFNQTPKFSSGQIRTSNDIDPSKGLGWNDVPNQVTVAFTWYGDINLDGQVDITDLGILATNWQSAGPWGKGDFNYDNFVDITDLGQLATNWQQGVGNPLGPSIGEALASVGLGGVSIPEPATIGMLAAGLAGVASRRRRRG